MSVSVCVCVYTCVCVSVRECACVIEEKRKGRQAYEREREQTSTRQACVLEHHYYSVLRDFQASREENYRSSVTQQAKEPWKSTTKHRDVHMNEADNSEHTHHRYRYRCTLSSSVHVTTHSHIACSPPNT